MKVRRMAISWVFFSLTVSQSFADSDPSYRSKYVGQEKREIKSLSEGDIDALRKGKGWGLAKAAELNGVPGPVHLLEMSAQIKLTDEQIGEIKGLYDDMKKRAIPLGLQLIELEGKLNKHFADRTISYKRLQEMLEEIAQVHKQLRYVHLSTHLKTPKILTSHQITLYNRLRGYSSDDPCKNIPAGHDPEMWKRHNNCR